MSTQAIRALFLKDLRLFFANRFFAFVTVLGLVAYIAMFYLLPSSLDERLALGIYMPDMPPSMANMLEQDEVRILRADSPEALRQAISDNEVPVGFVFPTDSLNPIRAGQTINAELLISADMPVESHAIYEAILREFGFLLSGQQLAIETTEVVLGRDLAGQAIAPRLRLLPTFAVMVLMIECLGLASLIVGEITAGTMRALLVTPLSMSGMFLGKGLFGTLFAFSQASLLMLATGGLSQQPLLILTALLLGAALVTGVAFLIASVGCDLMSVMGWGILAILLLVLPTITLVIPGLSTGWERLIPSFYLADTVFQASNFGTGWANLASNLLWLAVYAAGFMALGVLVLRRRFR
ncbi:MAG: ABC transporter permease [Oscillochloridaceae bacterium umkhey_bin13]